MKLPRRTFLHLAAGAAALPAMSHIARAQAYPSRPVKIIVGFPAGGVGDILARLVGQSLSARLGQPFIIENRPGASTNIATEAVVNAAPDGYTLLFASTANTINAPLYKNLNFNFVRDIVPIASIARSPLVMMVNPSIPANTVPEFIAYAKANPGKLKMAVDIGAISHLAGDMFKMMSGIDMVDIPYNGSPPSMAAVISGQVQVRFDAVATSIWHIRAGTLRALAATTATRLEILPDLPALSEFFPGYEAVAWNGIGAPKNTPQEIVDKLNREVNADLADPNTKARITEVGSVPMPMTTAEFGKFIADETEKWANLIHMANIKPQ
jgi:tripartite-type tricarboxylate transporter receptor subunit TctC